jgi:hypothetical protein
MSLPWATFLHFGASFCDAPYILLQSDFIALTVVCDILNASFHCDILSVLLRTCCCSFIIVALHRTMGSLPLHYWHHLPWCFLDELACCGQLRLVNTGWDFLWLHYSFSASLDLVARLPSIIVALTSLSVLMSTDILVSFSEVQHLVEIRSFKGLQSAGVHLCDWSILLIPPSSMPIPLAPSALFPVPTCGNGLLLNNVDNTFNLYDGCTRC